MKKWKNETRVAKISPPQEVIQQKTSNDIRIDNLNNESENKKQKLKENKTAQIKAFQKKCIYHKDGDIADSGPQDYSTGTKCGNMVGDRIRFILNSEGMTITELEKRSGIRRSSLQRYLKEIDPDIPKASTLEKIIDALPCTFDDFLYSPEDFEKWKNGVRRGYILPLTMRSLDFNTLKFVVMDRLSRTLIYMVDGKYYDIPPHIVDLLVKQVYSAFEVAETLLEYEKLMPKSKGSYILPDAPEQDVRIQRIGGETIIIKKESSQDIARRKKENKASKKEKKPEK